MFTQACALGLNKTPANPISCRIPDPIPPSPRCCPQRPACAPAHNGKPQPYLERRQTPSAAAIE